jgi:hypothetical protein
MSGCACVEATVAYRESIRRLEERDTEARRRARLAAIETEYQRWHGPHTRVSINSLLLLIARLPNARAFWDEATQRERQLAVRVLSRRESPLTGRLVGPAEMGEWLGGLGPERIRRALDDFTYQRVNRTARRLAEANWRAVHKHAGDRAG